MSRTPLDLEAFKRSIELAACPCGGTGMVKAPCNDRLCDDPVCAERPCPNGHPVGEPVFPLQSFDAARALIAEVERLRKETGR